MPAIGRTETTIPKGEMRATARNKSRTGSNTGMDVSLTAEDPEHARQDARTSESRAGCRSDQWGERGTAGAAIAARLAFEAVSHAYDGAASVREVSLTVDPGEVLCLLGHSGCGKTTLLRIAAGVERQRSGRVLINGREIAGPSVFLPPERRGIGLMFQDYALFPHLSILDNVRFGLTALPAGEAEAEALHALERVGLKNYARDYPHALSGRRATARGAGARDRAAAVRPVDGRAVFRARPAHARQRARRDHGGAARDARDLHHRHPRSGRGPAHGRPHCPHAGRAADPAGDLRRALQSPGRHLRGAVLFRTERTEGNGQGRAVSKRCSAASQPPDIRTGRPRSSACGRRRLACRRKRTGRKLAGRKGLPGGSSIAIFWARSISSISPLMALRGRSRRGRWPGGVCAQASMSW